MWTFGIALPEWLEVGHVNEEILTSALTWTQHYITGKPKFGQVELNVPVKVNYVCMYVCICMCTVHCQGTTD